MEILKEINEFWPIIIGLGGIALLSIKLWHQIKDMQARVLRLEAKMKDTNEADLKLSASLAKINLTLNSLVIEQKAVVKSVKALLAKSNMGDIL